MLLLVVVGGRTFYIILSCLGRAGVTGPVWLTDCVHVWLILSEIVVYTTGELETGVGEACLTLWVSEWVSEQCFTSQPTQYRLYGRRFLQVKRPNQQYQSTEGDATKEKENNENN